ncbi:MAG: sigma-54 dependent transcriptional regulator [bacterium]
MSKIFVVDDEIQICESLKMILEYENYSVDSTTNPLEAKEIITNVRFDAILLDIQMPEMNGFELLNYISTNSLNSSVIIISAHSNLENAVKATKLGAFDFIEKPIDREKLLITIRNAVKHSLLERENEELKKTVSYSDTIIGISSSIKSILDTVEIVAKTDVRILITGDNGTGKELIARELHKRSIRVKNEMIEVNCAAIPNELIESELFGHEKGSFTGAANQRIGKFELADKSTLFLDEIGDMSLQAQAKVLRAIEDGQIERVGGNKKIKVDVRIIAATNKDLKEQISLGNFREDLFHRLNVIPIHIPPLRERKDDIPLLVEYFTKQICEKNKFPLKSFHKRAVELLKSFEWTGNIRELRNFIERIIIMTTENEITEKDVLLFLPATSSKINDILDVSNSFQQFKEKAEKAFILKQLEANNWNISKTSEILEIQRSHLYSKMKKYEIDKGR